MNSKFLFITITLALILSLTSACQAPSAPEPGGSFQAWIDSPLDGSSLSLSAQQIVLHASGPNGVTAAEIQINDVIQFTATKFDQESNLFKAQQSWLPEGPGEYTIQVRVKDRAGEWAESAPVHVTVLQHTAAPAEVPALLLTTSTPALEICDPIITATGKSTCRSGPSPFNSPLVYLQEGDTGLILGHNADRTWWFIQPASQNQTCWISDQIVEADCLNDSVPYQESPPYITRIIVSNPEIYWGDYHIQSTTIQAQAGGESPVSSVRLIYHLQNKSDWMVAVMQNTSPGIWVGTIQAHDFKNYRQISSAIVEYYLEATSENGLTTQTGILADIRLKEVPR